jgi:hypothetical protein
MARTARTPRPTGDSPSAIAEEVEATIRRVAPSLDRVIKYGAPTFRGAGDVCTIGVWTTFVAVGFWNGARLANDHPLLEGTGRTSRVAKLRSREEARSPAFARLVREAARLDRSDPVRTG